MSSSLDALVIVQSLMEEDVMQALVKDIARMVNDMPMNEIIMLRIERRLQRPQPREQARRFMSYAPPLRGVTGASHLLNLSVATCIIISKNVRALWVQRRVLLHEVGRMRATIYSNWIYAVGRDPEDDDDDSSCGESDTTTEAD
jgi:hypothetical protein